MKKRKLVEKAQQKGDYFKEKLFILKEKYPLSIM